MYNIQQISTIINATTIIKNNSAIEHLLIDSRKISFATTSLFFALVGERRDGHVYIDEVYKQGVRNFVIQKNIDISLYHDANFLQVENTLQALQILASQHRQKFSFPIIGITGSNGKTIVKEWLFQLLHNDFNIVRSPKSYNSQIGVPLSIWQINNQHNLGIFEAGISTLNEMQWLENIIKPTIGILTNIGVAHNEGFKNKLEKLKEKLQLFANCNTLIYCNNDDEINNEIKLLHIKNVFSWGNKSTATLQIVNTKNIHNSTTITAIYNKREITITIPFIDAIAIENACSCWCSLLLLNIDDNTIKEKMLQLHAVEMRMQLLKATNNCTLINDSYSNDSSSFNIALEYLITNASNLKKTIIISDFGGGEKKNKQVYLNFIHQIIEKKIDKLIGIGEVFSEYSKEFALQNIEAHFYTSTEAFLLHSTTHQFKDECILVKGARVFNFESICKWLQQKTHQTVMEINLTAMVHNLKEYQKHLQPATKTMAMVKAFSYGSGTAEVARLLQFCKVDYLAVAYTDEGVELRKAGIHLPIMVLNVEEENFDDLIEYNLEPEIFSLSIYDLLNEYLLENGLTNFAVHIKVNTGMNRLGFEPNEVDEISGLISSNKTMLVKTVLSHLAASEAPEHDDFTNQQLQKFNEACATIKKIIGYNFIKHIANSAAIFRHKNAEYNMVRLGIGLYGVDSATTNQINLQTVATLKTSIAQIRTVKANDTVGYNRRGLVKKDSKIATIRIGYADGLSRSLGNGKGFVFLNNKLAPIIGSVCMDMTMIDVTEIEDAKENDVVEIFGKHLSVSQVAAWSNTIAYETLSTISQRVKRVYVEE